MSKVRTRKRGKTYSYAFEVGKQDNKRKVIEKGGYPTEEAAYLAGMEAYIDWKNVGLTTDNPTVREYLLSWLNDLTVKPPTLKSYKHSVVKNINPYIGDILLKELTPSDVDKWVHKLSTKNLAYTTIHKICTTLKIALKHAVYPRQIIKNNPAAYINVPKNTPKKIKQRKIITLPHFQELLTQAPPFMQIPLRLLFHTGMRLGEVLGLLWEDIDLDNATITIKRQLASDTTALSTPKTASSIRTIPIDTVLIDILNTYRLEQLDSFFTNTPIQAYLLPDTTIIEVTLPYTPPQNATPIEFVCTGLAGKHISHANMHRYLRKLGVNAHSFRHTHATMLIEAGATPKGVAGRLGHVDATITQNLYTHNTRKLQEDTVQTLNDLLLS